MNLFAMFMPVPDYDPDTDWGAIAHEVGQMMLRVATMFM